MHRPQELVGGEDLAETGESLGDVMAMGLAGLLGFLVLDEGDMHYIYICYIDGCTHTHARTCIYIYTHIHMYIYIIRVCICVQTFYVINDEI